MRLQKSFQLALNILLHSKLRSWLTIIGIVIGVAAIVAIVSIGEGAQANVNARLGGLGADLITVSPGFQRASQGFRFGGGERTTTTKDTKNLTANDVQVIKSVQGVAFVDPIVSGRAAMTYLAESSEVSVQGVDPQIWSNTITATLASGRFLNPGDTNVIVIGSQVAAGTFKQPLALNRNVVIEGMLFKIVGVLQASGGFGGSDRSVIMPIAEARVVLKAGPTALDSITIKASSTDLVNTIVNETTAKLMLSRHENARTQDFTVTSAQALQQQIQSVTQTFTLFLGAIAAVSLIVGAVGIANTMFTSVLEKTKEIGIMKAIGAKNFDIMFIFLLNSGLVGLVGGLIGIMLGSGISYVLPNFLSGFGGLGGTSLKTVIPLSLLIEAVVISVIIGMIAGTIPAYRASKLKPVDALRYE